MAQDWWMYHGGLSHSGEAADSDITSANVSSLELRHSIDVPGSILSTPAIVGGSVFVGLANTLEVAKQNGGELLKFDLESGKRLARFKWAIKQDERDSHSFAGMGVTPAVAEGRVVFTAFNGKLYCLSDDTLKLQWVTDLRHADLKHNQPVTNEFGGPDPKAAGWSSPVLHDDRVYVGIGEGENDRLYAFVYCLDANTGNVIWVFCTNEFEKGRPNRSNELPVATLKRRKPPAGFTTFNGKVPVKGASVWSSIAYDPELDQLYCATGNPTPDAPLPTPGYSNSVVVLQGKTGEFLASVQIPAGSSYRPSDNDVDIGGSPTLYEADGRKLVGIGCKNGAYVTIDAHSFEIVRVRQLLPFRRDGTQIEAVDPHGPDQGTEIGPVIPNDVSNTTPGENYSGTYSTAAVCTSQGKLFIGVGGNNYHFLSPGIDAVSTPFIRAMDWSSLADAWALDDGDPQRYAIATQQPGHPLYKMGGESGLSVPAVAGDVVFMATTRVALYAFSASDGELLWSDTDNFGPQTGGASGGYGYCMGPAVAGNFVVAGALVAGESPGVLNIYSLPEAER